MMAGIRGKDTKPEIMVRKALHHLGYRYRLHDRKLPGKPDLVLPRYRAVILIHGCFWHAHECHLFKWPSTRNAFWREKIGRNRCRDANVANQLSSLGWRQLTIWECALKGKKRKSLKEVVALAETWLNSDKPVGEIKGG
tara:strand:+ start:2824 stop:3240 length:417 start_codon:yes stop_codon:yes gene_type:complete